MADREPAPTQREGIQVIRRAAQVIRVLRDQRGGLRLADLAAHLDLPKTTIHRIVTALADEQLLRIDPAGRIWFGSAIVELARSASNDLATQLRPILVDVARATGESVELSVLDAGFVRVIDEIPSAHRLRAVTAAGASLPVHCTAPGKAFLAAIRPDRAEGLVPPTLEAYTPHTMTTRAAILDALPAIRRAGVAEDLEEHTAGIIGLAAVINDRGGPAAAISVALPAERWAARADLLRTTVRHASRDATILLSS